MTTSLTQTSALLPPNTQVGKAANGRWWVHCTRPSCDGGYTGGLLSKDAAIACGYVHQAHHDGAARGYRARATDRV